MKHIHTFESFLNEGLHESADYAVMLTGGSIGDKSRPRDAKGYAGMEVDGAEELMNLADAKAKAKRMNANLSPGEKSHYRLKYVVVPAKNGKFIKESLLNESTLKRFVPNTIDRATAINEKFFKSLMPKTAATAEEAMEKIWTFEGNTMFAHYQYIVVKPNGNKPGRPTYRIHQIQYYLNDYEMKLQGRDPKESVNVTFLTIFDITDGQDIRLGQVYVDTKVFLDEYKRVFEITETVS